MADRDTVQRVFQEHEPTAVVHFAAESHVDRSIDDPGEFVRTNVEGTFQMLDAARQYWKRLPEDRRAGFRFLHVSTDEVYGSLGATGRFTESSPYDPSSPYSASKAAADHFARAYFRTYGLPVLVTNCSNNYGPCQFPEKLLPLMILNAVEGKPLPVYGDGQNVRDWLYVEDHCRALECVLAEGQPGETYNIGGNAEQTNLAVVRMVCRLVDELRPGLPHAPCESLITFVRDRPGHDRRYAIDATKIQAQLSWRPQHDFPSGLRRTVAVVPGQSPLGPARQQRGLSTRASRPEREVNSWQAPPRESFWPAAPAPGSIPSRGPSASNCCPSTTSRWSTIRCRC